MDLCVFKKMKCASDNAWKLLTDKGLFEQWYGTPVTDASFCEGGFIAFAAQGDRPAYQSAIVSFTEGSTFTISGDWTDEKFTLYPEADGCVIEKQVTLKNGLVFTPEGLQQEGPLQEARLQAFTEIADRTFPAVVPGVVPMAGAVEQPAKKGKGKKLAIILGSSAALLVAAGVAVFFLLLRPYWKEQDRIERYNRGAKAIEEGDYEKASSIFRDLGDYDDSEEMLAYAQKGINYENAKKSMQDGNYREAKELLSEHDDFKDSATLITQCNYAIAFADAQELADAGRYEEALQKLSEAGSNPDKYKIEARCKEALAQENVEKFIAEKKYQEALDILNSEEGKKVENRASLIKTCNDGLAYAEAVALYREEKYYSAYNKFKSLGNYEDSQSYMNSCVQPTPSTKELYHNSAYSGKNVSLKIQPPTGDGNVNYIKLYIVSGGQEILVSTIFIEKGRNYTVKIPSGNYVIKVAYGSGSWYGEKEMFGSNATYERLQSTETSDVFTMQPNYSYTLTLRSAQSGNVRTKNEKRDDF